jgi:hypothetical protein
MVKHRNFLLCAAALPALLTLFADGDGGDGAGGAGAGAGAAGAAGAADGAGAAGAGAAGAAGDGAPSWTKPDGLPENLAGKDAGETLDKVFGAYKGLRDKLAAAPAAPKTAEDYGKLTFSDEFKKTHGDLEEADAPVMKLVRDHALAAGIPVDQFQKFATGLLEQAVKDGVIEPGIDPKAEIEKAGGEDKYRDRAGAIDTRLDGLKAQGKLNDGELAELKAARLTADGMAAVEKLLALSGEKGTETGGGNAGGELADMSAVKAAMMDDRYDSTSPKFDKAYVEKVNAAGKRLTA